MKQIRPKERNVPGQELILLSNYTLKIGDHVGRDGQAADHEQGHAEVQIQSGEMYDEGGHNTAHDLSAVEAVKWYRKAEQGNAEAQSILVNLLYSQKVTEAAKWYRKAVEQGNVLTAAAQTIVGHMYYNGEGGVAQSFGEAAKWYRKAAKQGHAEAQSCLVQLLYQQSANVAAKWYHMAVEQGNVLTAAAQTIAGHMHYNGEGGVAQSFGEAAKWYRKAAKQGNAEAQSILVHLLYSQKNFKEAAKWYYTAVEQGNALTAAAQITVGHMHYAGEGGVAQSASEAAKWYRMAAEQGHAGAQSILAKLHGEQAKPDQRHLTAGSTVRQKPSQAPQKERSTAATATGQTDNVQVKSFLSAQLQARELTSEQFQRLTALAGAEDAVLMRIYRLNRSKGSAKLRSRLIMAVSSQKHDS